MTGVVGPVRTARGLEAGQTGTGLVISLIAGRSGAILPIQAAAMDSEWMWATVRVSTVLYVCGNDRSIYSCCMCLVLYLF